MNFQILQLLFLFLPSFTFTGKTTKVSKKQVQLAMFSKAFLFLKPYKVNPFQTTAGSKILPAKNFQNSLHTSESRSFLLQLHGPATLIKLGTNGDARGSKRLKGKFTHRLYHVAYAGSVWIMWFKFYIYTTLSSFHV